MRQKTFLLGAALLMLTPMSAMAQNDDNDEDSNYSYVTIDLYGGTSQNLKSYGKLADHGLSVLGHGDLGGMMGFRLTGYWTDHLGAFVETDLHMNEYNTSQLSRTLFGDTKHHYSPSDIYSYDYCSTYDAVRYATLMAGVTYRYDIYKLSIRPRLGLGMRSLDYSDCSISNQQHTQPGEYHMTTYDFYLKNRDNEIVSAYHAFAFNPGIQFCLTPRHNMYFSFDISWTGTLSKLYQVTEMETYDVVGIDYENGNSGTITNLTETSKQQRVSMGNFLDIRFGIGWNIGRK